LLLLLLLQKELLCHQHMISASAVTYHAFFLSSSSVDARSHGEVSDGGSA
jgi:hypothetical protein